MVLSGLCFLVVNFFVKLLGSNLDWIGIGQLQKYPGHELVLARSIVSFLLSLWIIRRKKLPVFGVNRKWLLIRGLSGTIALTIFFYTLHYLPMAVASVVQYLAPIFTVIFAMVLLNEKVRLLQWFFIGVSFSGVVLVGWDSIAGNATVISPFWLGLGMLSAVFSGIAYTAIVKLRTTDAPISIVLYFPMVAIPFMVIFCLFEFIMPQGVEWVILLIIGLFTQFAQILLTKALHEAPASNVTPIQYLGAIYAFLIGYFVFEEALSWIVSLGILLIIFGVTLNAILRKRI